MQPLCKGNYSRGNDDIFGGCVELKNAYMRQLLDDVISVLSFIVLQLFKRK